MVRPKALVLVQSGALAAFAIVLLASGAALAQSNPRNGQYIASASGCFNCHTEDKSNASPYAGGRPLGTPFGIFRTPNITPHATTGIGKWSFDDFKRAMRRGERPDGASYYPSFPYPSYAGMSDTDLADLWAFLRMVPPANQSNSDHSLKFPFGWRPLIYVWKLLFFKPGGTVVASPANNVLARGEYLVRVLGHCGECHTPRNFLGVPKSSQYLGGGEIEEGKVPNITPYRLKQWSDENLRTFLRTGVTPEGDTTSDAMNEVVVNATSKLSQDDLTAMIAFLRSVPSVTGNKK